jgi:hypothetical protein
MLHLIRQFGAAVVFILAIVIGVLMMRRSARRFMAEQQRVGRWDKNGPLHPTQGPPHRTAGGSMDERLEVSGQWTPKPVDSDLGERDRSN